MPTFVKSVVEQGSEGAVTPRVNVRRPEGGGSRQQCGLDCTGAASQQTRLSPGPTACPSSSPPASPTSSLAPASTSTSFTGYSHFPQRPQVCPSCRGTGMTKLFRSASHLNPNVFKSSQDGPASSQLSPRPALPTVTGVKTVQNCQKPEKPFVRAALRPGHY